MNQDHNDRQIPADPVPEPSENNVTDPGEESSQPIPEPVSASDPSDTAPLQDGNGTFSTLSQPEAGMQSPLPPPPHAETQPAVVYRWTYAEQKQHDAQRKQKQRLSGVGVYALVMTVVFALSFGLLVGVMFMKGEAFEGIQFSEPVTNEAGDVVSTTDKMDAAAIEKAKHSVVLIEVSNSSAAGSGTGIILSEDGYIATNYHVVELDGDIRVKFYDGSYVRATIRGYSEVDDLAVIKVDKSGLVPAVFAKSSECFVGQTVYAIGNPSGPDMAWTTTRGCISYVDRELKIYKDDGTLEKKLKMLQTDAMVNPGNSGGPLVNTNGEVVGIVSMKMADGYEGLGFAIPSEGAAEILNAIIKDGHANNVNSSVSSGRPLIGITGVYVEEGCHYVFNGDRIMEVDEAYAEKFPEEVVSPKVSGIYVKAVSEGTDAATKLSVGDIITAVNGVEAKNMAVLSNEINQHYPGDEISLTYYRNGLFNDITVTLTSQ